MHPQIKTRRLPAALALAAVTTLVAAAPAAADVRVSENWAMRPDANPIHGRDALGLAANPRDRRHVVGVYADWATLWCETAVSFNGGRSWRRSRLKAPAGFINPPCTVGGHLSSQLGSTVGFGRDRNVYTAFASARLTEQGGEQGRAVLVAKSTDGGRTWGTAVEAMPGGANPDVGPDHVIPKLVVRPGSGDRADRIYVVAGSREFTSVGGPAQDEIRFTASMDGGRSWAPPKAIDGPGSAIEPSQPVLGRDNRLLVAWRTRKPGDRPGTYAPEGTIVVARSRDDGATWRLRGVAGVRGYVHEGPREVPFATVQIYTNSSFPRLAADRRTGAVYVVYNNGSRPTRPNEFRTADHFIHPDSDVWFQRSANHGEDWSAALQLNDAGALTSEVTQTRQPNVAVAPGGRVDVAWNDRRHWYRGCLHTHNPCLETRLGDTYYTYSTNGGRSFRADRRVTDRSMNLDVGYDYRFGTYWEYAPAIAHLGSRRVLLGWMDTRDGNIETDTQSLYLARVDHDASGRVPERTISAPGARRLAVELSRRAYTGGPEAVLGGTFATRPWTRVVIANENDPASVLAAGVLARAHIGTVLLSSRDGLDQRTRDEVARLNPIGAIVVGSRDAVPDSAVAQLVATGIPLEQIARIEGASRADTARRIAVSMDRRTAPQREAGHPAFDAAVLVNPADDDGYAAAVIAAARRLPVLFASRDTVPAATRQAIEALGIRKVLVAGGRGAIADGALAGLPAPQRLSGSKAVTASRAIAGEARRRAVADGNLFATTGRMEAALLGATGARIGGQLVMAGRSDARRAARNLNSSHFDRIFHVRIGSGG